MASSVFVPGIPAPQGSKRHVGRGVMVESSKKVGPWRKQIVKVAREAGLHESAPDGASMVVLTFILPRPKGHFGTGRNAGVLKPSAPAHHTTYPDVDKLTRAVFDALQTAGAVVNDSSIVRVSAAKQYGQVPGVHIVISDAQVTS
jgi:crossover junction endodeoxyribonuclease RusA